MSKREVPSLDRGKATTEGSLDSYQSVWIARWKAAKQTPRNKSSFLSLNGETRELDSYSGQEVTSSQSQDCQLREVPVKSTVNVEAVTTKAADVVDGTVVAMVSQNPSNEEPVSMPSLVLGLTLPDHGASTSRNERASGCYDDEACNPLAMQSSSKNWIAGCVDDSKLRLASANLMGKKNTMVSTPLKGNPLLQLQLPSSEHNTDGNRLNAVSANTPSLRNRALSLLPNDKPLTVQKMQLTFLTKNFHEGFVCHHQAILSQSSPLEAAKPETRHPVIDVNTTTTHTFVGSSEGLTSGHPTFSQTKHQLFYSEKTDIQLCPKGQILRDTSHGKNNTLGQFLSLSMKSLTDSEEHENHVKGRTSVLALKNKSSAETNTFNMNALPMKLLTSESSSFPRKEPSSSVEGSGCMLKTDLRDRKRKFLALALRSSSPENDEPSPSKARSFEAKHLLPHEDQGACSRDHGGPEQRMKQLKATEPDHPLESLKMEDKFPVEKEREKDKDLLGLGLGSGHSTRPAKNGVSTTAVDNTNAQKGRRALLLLADPWFRRWRHNRAAAVPEKKAPVIRCDPFWTKTFGDLWGKRMPSAAAMALMCKTMNGFHPRDFQSRGSYVMWKS